MSLSSTREAIYLERLQELKQKIEKIDLVKMEITPEDLLDEYCNPDHPVKIQFNDVSAAAYRIKGGVDITPCTVKSLNAYFINKL